MADPSAGVLAPGEDGIERVDLVSGNVQLLMPLAELAAHDPVEDMSGATHYVNHIQMSPGGEQVAFFHIWKRSPEAWRVRLYAMGLDGSHPVCLLDSGIISHYDWLDDDQILVWARKRDLGERFLLCDRRDRSTRVIGDGELTEDGHCSFSPDRAWVLNDTYPDGYDMRTLMLYR